MLSLVHLVIYTRILLTSYVWGSILILSSNLQPIVDTPHLVNQVLHMDRNDYYGGESTSLNLIQVYVVILCATCMIKLVPFFLLVILMLLMYSSGRGLEEVISPQIIWVLVGTIMWTWSQRFLSSSLYCVAVPFNIYYFIMPFQLINVFILQVYNGKWCSCTCPYSHQCYKIFVLQSCGWQFCV